MVLRFFCACWAAGGCASGNHILHGFAAQLLGRLSGEQQRDEFAAMLASIRDNHARQQTRLEKFTAAHIKQG